MAGFGYEVLVTCVKLQIVLLGLLWPVVVLSWLPGSVKGQRWGIVEH
jgi:hypothetical protein